MLRAAAFAAALRRKEGSASVYVGVIRQFRIRYPFLA
jgi:hypothetical protein